MQDQAITVATDGMAKYTIEKDIAQYIKKEFDSRFGATWHCIVGRNFGSFVTHGRSFAQLVRDGELDEGVRGGAGMGAD